MFLNHYQTHDVRHSPGEFSSGLGAEILAVGNTIGAVDARPSLSAQIAKASTIEISCVNQWWLQRNSSNNTVIYDQITGYRITIQTQ